MKQIEAKFHHYEGKKGIDQKVAFTRRWVKGLLRIQVISFSMENSKTRDNLSAGEIFLINLDSMILSIKKGHHGLR